MSLGLLDSQRSRLGLLLLESGSLFSLTRRLQPRLSSRVLNLSRVNLHLLLSRLGQGGLLSKYLSLRLGLMGRISQRLLLAGLDQSLLLSLVLAGGIHLLALQQNLIGIWLLWNLAR